MGTYDDDYYEDEDELGYDPDNDPDDDDEAVSSSRKSVNPFFTGSARESSGLPGADRYAANRPAGGRPIGSGTGRSEPPPARDPKEADADRSRFFGGGGASSSSASSSGGGGGLGSRLSSGVSRSATPPPRPGDPGSRPGGPASGGLSRSPSAADEPEKKSGGGFKDRLGGMMSGLGKKDDKKPSGPGGGSGGSFGGPSRAAPPKDKASGGGMFGKLGGMLPGKGKKDASKSSSGGSPFRAASDKDKAKTSGGGLGGMFGKLGGMLPGKGKKADGAPVSGGGSARPSPYSSGPGGPSRSSYGQSSDAHAPPKEKKPGFLAGLRQRWGGGDDDKKAARTSKTRAHQEKTPHMTDEGLSLDQKLDLLGVGLVFGSLVLFFSSLSPEQGALTGTINTFFSQIFGWGALGVPIALAAAGVWLIVRHFGEEAPEIDPVRLGGVALGYVGLLMVFMFIETWSDFYRTATQADFHLYVAISVREGRGGGWVGAELYSLLVTNFGEISAFVFVLGWLVVAVMLMTRTSAAELAIFVISIWRSLRIALQHRAQRSAAIAAEKRAAALAAQQEQLRISGPEAPELPAGQQRALPPGEEPLPIEQRDITIRMGGQTIDASAEAPVTVSAEHAVAHRAAPDQPPKAGGGRLGGLTSRLKGAIPAVLPFASKNGDDDSGDDDSEADTAPAGDTGKKPLSLGSLLKSRSESSGQAAASTRGAPEAASPAASKPAPFILDDDEPDDDLADDYDDDYDDDDDDGLPYAARPASDNGDSRFRPRAFDAVAQSAPSRPAFIADDLDDDDADDDTDDDSAPFDRDDRMTRQPAASATPPPAPGGGSLSSRLRSGGLSPRPADSDSGAAAPRPTPPPTSGGGSLFGARSSAPQPEEPRREEPQRDESPAPPATAPTGETAAHKNVPAAAAHRNGAPEPDEQPEARPVAGSLAERLSALRAMGAAQAARPELLDRPAVSSSPAPEAPPARPADAADQPPASPEPPPSDAEPARNAESQGSLFRSTPPARQPEPAPEPEPQPKPQPEPVINPPAARPAVPAPPQKHTTRQRRQWQLPDYQTLLASGSEGDFDRDQLVQRARIIEETLASFGAPGKVVEINTGPVITQFGIEPDYLTARGGKKNRVKVGAIAALDKDLQLALGAKSIRVEAPVPGKGFVGIEVPNEEASLVSLRDVMESRQFTRIKSPLAIALGQSVDGAPVAADLTAMPHLLVAGTTGSGKSVLVNAIIASLLVRNTPDQVRFIMVDPKRVELTGYNGIPHLVAPVVVDLERIVGVLKWVTREMDDRYKRFSTAQARNIVDFNAHLPAGEEPMPYIVVIIDELADLMMMAPDETERVITRIAALARATGIHLVIATQRPSVDVVTGLIKANFPARVAFAVAGSVDSRVILDQPGAERLLGKGDMLYMSGNSPAPVRLQGVYVSDMEINNINRFWRGQSAGMEPQKLLTALGADDDSDKGRSSSSARSRQPAAPSEAPQRSLWDDLTSASADEHSAAFGSTSRDNDGHEDELYDEAVELVRRLNKASVSLLQRRLRIGYTRAARLIDIMEAEGVVGPPVEGSKPREVLPYKK